MLLGDGAVWVPALGSSGRRLRRVEAAVGGGCSGWRLQRCHVPALEFGRMQTCCTRTEKQFSTCAGVLQRSRAGRSRAGRSSGGALGSEGQTVAMGRCVCARGPAGLCLLKDLSFYCFQDDAFILCLEFCFLRCCSLLLVSRTNWCSPGSSLITVLVQGLVPEGPGPGPSGAWARAFGSSRFRCALFPVSSLRHGSFCSLWVFSL